MKVLVVNDDGINAKGINVLAEALRKNHEVFVLAPHVNRSCSSNCIIMQTALEIEPFKDSLGNQIKNMYTTSRTAKGTEAYQLMLEKFKVAGLIDYVTMTKSLAGSIYTAYIIKDIKVELPL